jgi:ubiquinol-cytochrome c reductase cytochrome c subunit
MSLSTSRLSRVLGVLLVVGAALWLTAVLRSGPALAGAGPSASPTTASATSALGRRVYLRDCAWCHGISAQGTARGPDLRGAGPAYVDFMLRTGRMPLLDPNTSSRPQRPKYDSATIAALVQYVGEELGSGDPIPRLTAGDVVAGRTLFLANCAACHSSSGTGTILQDGTHVPQLWATRSEQIAEAVRVGPGEMPPFGPKTVDDQELSDVVSYVQQLGPAQAPGGNGLDQYGPIAESLVAFLVPLPLLVLFIVLIGRRAPRREPEE